MRQLFACLCFTIWTLAPAAVATDTTPAEGLRTAPPRSFALVGGTVVVEPGKVLDSATIVVRDGHIESVTENGEPPAGVRVIDLSAKTVYPGFIDSYAARDITSNVDGPGYWNSKITPQARMAAEYDADSDLNKKLRGQGFVARLLAPRDGIIKGTSVLVSTGDGAAGEAVWAADVAQHMRLTVPFSRDRSGYPNSPMGAVALARQAMCDAQWYAAAQAVAAADPSLERPDENVALATLATYLSGTRLVMVNVSNEQFAQRADRFAREFGLHIALVGSGREYRRLDEIAAARRPIVVPVDFPKPPELNSPQAIDNASLGELMHWQLAPSNPARLADAGVSILLTTDGLSDAGKFLSNLRQAIEHGLNPDDALRALTTRPAAMFGVDDRLGTIEPGKMANLVVADGDLFTSGKAKVIETWVAGQRYESKPPPLVEFDGQWRLTLSQAMGGSKRWQLAIESEKGKPTAKLSPLGRKGKQRDKQADENEAEEPEALVVKSLDVSGFSLDGQVEGDLLEVEGKATLAVTLVGGDKRTALFGSLRLADGSDVAIKGKRVPADTDDSNGEDENAKEGSEDEKDADDDDEEGDTNGEQADADTDDEGDEGDADVDADEKDSSDEWHVAVNYPFGAYGFEAPPEAERVAFVGATIWTGGEAGIIDNATLLVEDGKIVAVGADVEVPKGYRQIDCRGKHVTAGIIDCHSHIASDSGINESGQAITAEVRIGDMIDPTAISIYRQLAGGVTAINILHGSANPIGGQNQVVKMRWGATGEGMKFAAAPQGIKFALGENVKQSNWGERFSSRYPQTRMGVDELMIDEFEAALAYQQKWDEWEATHRGLPPRRDLELEAIAEILNHERWIHCHSYRQSEIVALLRTLERFDIQIGTLQHILEGYKVAPEMAAHGAMGSSFSDWWAYKFEVYDAIPHNGALMHEAGIVVSFNSDDAELGRHLNHEAAKAMKYGGVPPEEAWKFVTLNPARQLRIDEYTGSLEAEKDADLVVWNGPPMSTYSRCEQTWVDGRCYFDIERDGQLRERDRKLKARLVAAALDSGQAAAKPGENRDDDSMLWPNYDDYCARHGHGYAGK